MDTNKKIFDNEYNKIIQDITEYYFTYKKCFTFLTTKQIKEHIINQIRYRLDYLISLDELVKNSGL